MLAPEFLPVWGGVGTYIVEMARHLKDVELHILTPKRTSFGNGKLDTDYDMEKIFPENVHIHFVSNASDTFLYNAKFQYACFKRAPDIIKENRIDIIHSHTAHMPDVFLNLRKPDVKTVTTIHTTIKGQRIGTGYSGTKFLDLEFSEKMTYLMYPFLRFIEESYFKRKNKYIVVSNWMKNQIIEEQNLNYEDVSVVHNGVNPQIFTPKKCREAPEIFPELFNEDKIKILFSSRFIELKGARFLLDAIPNILKKIDAHFIFAGTGKINLNIPKENYTLLNYVDYLKMPYLYCSSDVFVLTSLYENFPIAVLEAMSSGLGVISTDVGGVPEIINSKNGILIPKADSNAVAQNVVNLAENGSLRYKLGKNARKTIKKGFTWNLAATKTKGIYEKAVEA